MAEVGGVPQHYGVVPLPKRTVDPRGGPHNVRAAGLTLCFGSTVLLLISLTRAVWICAWAPQFLNQVGLDLVMGTGQLEKTDEENAGT